MRRFIYKKIIKPILFKFPADDVHNFFLKTGNYFGRNNLIKNSLNKILPYNNSVLNERVLSMNFKNPIGLAAGFDYDADLIDILPSVGFGMHTIGSVTYLPYKGNPRPMLGRLPKSKSLLVNKGFKSMGMESVLKKIGKRRGIIPLGLSIGSTNRAYIKIEDMAEDVFNSFKLALRTDFFDYFT